MGRHSLIGMLLPGLVVIFTPIIIGIFFGAEAVAGYLIGVIISGIQMATSSANSGGAWDNCKKSINNNGIEESQIEKLEREKRGLTKALEACKSHSTENKANVEKFEELIKQKDEEIKRLSEEQKENVLFTQKISESEEEKNEKEIQLKNNQRDADRCINDAQNTFYDDCKEAAVIGDTIGDPLKDTSGPSINILIKLSSIISVVFGSFFVSNSLVNFRNTIGTCFDKCPAPVPTKQ